MLHLVCQRCVRDVSPAQLAAVIRLHPEALRMQNNEGDTPLHSLCAHHRSPLELKGLVDALLGGWKELVGVVVEADETMQDGRTLGETAIKTQNHDGRLPLHVCCRCQRFAGKSSVDALRLLVEAYPEAAAAADAHAWTPLHLFAQFQLDPKPEGLDVVLLADARAAAATTAVDGDTPLHLACYAHRRTVAASASRILRRLAAFAPQAALRSCKQGRKAWDHLPNDDARYAEAVSAILGAVVDGLDDVSAARVRRLFVAAAGRRRGWRIVHAAV